MLVPLSARVAAGSDVAPGAISARADVLRRRDAGTPRPAENEFITPNVGTSSPEPVRTAYS